MTRRERNGWHGIRRSFPDAFAMWTLLMVLLWGVSLITFPASANGFWLPKDMAWLVGSWLLASSPFWNPPSRQTASHPALGWLLAWVMLSFGWFVCWPLMTVPQTEVGLQRAIIGRWYVSPVLPTLTFLGSLLAVDALVRHTDVLARWHRVALHLVRIAGVFAVLVIASAMQLDPITAVFPKIPWMNAHAITLLGNATITGNFLAILAPLCLMFQARRYRVGLFGLLVSAIWLTGSVTSLVAVWAGSTVTWALQRRWRWAWSSVGVAVSGGLWLWIASPSWLGSFVNPGGRWQLWQTAWSFWVQHPLNAWIGYGAGSVGALTTNGVWDYGYLHNEWLQWTFEFGLLGLGIALIACWQGVRLLRSMTWTGASTAWVGAAVAYGLVSLTSFPTRIGSLLMMGVVIAAAVLAHGQSEGVRHA